jgi:hypothetical protein
VDQIVAEVVRRLREVAGQPAAASSTAASGAAAPSPAQSAPPPKPKPQPEKSVQPDTLVLDARVVTTDTVYGRLQGIRKVVVPPRAVVTPSVRDDLQKRRIRLEFQEPDAQEVGPGDLTVVRFTRNTDASRASGTLPLPGGAKEHVVDELSAAVSLATQAVQTTQQLSVCLTDETLAAVCLLNRSHAVRAVQVRTADDVRRAVAAIGANVLVVDPRDMTANQWNVALQVFRKDLPRTPGI